MLVAAWLIAAPVEEGGEPTEELVVRSTANGALDFAPATMALDVIGPEDLTTQPSVFLDLVTAIPGVAENGQGGLLQSFSVRGLSRQRVVTQVAGVPMATERRAGASASFLDPSLIGSTRVLRGPGSVYHGSGALGGVVNVVPRQFSGLRVTGGYHSQGHATFAGLGWGQDDLSIGVAARRAGNARTPAGDRLRSGFTQTSGVFSAKRIWRGLELSLEAVGAAGFDIGKANIDDRARITTYPSEHHLTLRAAVVDPKVWRLEIWTHPNSLETQVRESLRESHVRNSAVDLGLRVERQLRWGDAPVARLGVDYAGRRGVNVRERKTLDGVASAVAMPMQDARQDELGVYALLEARILRWLVLTGGGRWIYHQQRNAREKRANTVAGSGFAGVLVVPLEPLELVANLGSGVRLPSLSERYFSGTTGRGQSQANPDLEPERAWSWDAAVRWRSERLSASLSAFHSQVSGFIERVAAGDGSTTFVNLTSGTLRGLELAGGLRITGNLETRVRGQLMEGRTRDGSPIADVPAHRVAVAAAWTSDVWHARAEWEYRARKADPGPGEKSIGSAALFSARAGYRVAEGWTLEVEGQNLTDESYFTSADEKTARAPGRSLGISLTWTPY
jgi:iron complex outermembrane receptor protein